MLSPARRRQCVDHLQAELGISERRACAVAGQHENAGAIIPYKAYPSGSGRINGWWPQCYARSGATRLWPRQSALLRPTTRSPTDNCVAPSYCVTGCRGISLSRISHRRIVWSLIIYCKQTVIEIFGKRQKYRVLFRSGPFFVRRREGLHGFGEPLQGAPCRRPVFPVLQHIDDRLVG